MRAGHGMRTLTVAAGLLTGVVLAESSASATPISALPNLSNITIYEATFVVTAEVFLPNDPELLARRVDPLTDVNSDFTYLAGEDYDVFYSTGDGTPDANGSFLTIEGVLTSGVFAGGMNITGVQLNFSVGPSLLADFVSSFQAVCDFGGCFAGSEALAVDGDLTFGTIPRMGATLAYPTEPTRMRLTLGWRGISQDEQAVPEPASLTLVGLGLIGLGARRWSCWRVS